MSKWRARHGLTVVLALGGAASLGAAALGGCDSCSRPASPPDGAAESVDAAARVDDDDAGSTMVPYDDDASPADWGKRFREAGPKVEADAEAPLDPACSGAEVSLASALADPRCAIGSGKAKAIRAELEREGKKLPLRQEAKLVAATSGPSAGDGSAGGATVAVRLVNTGTTTITLPLSYSSQLPAFTALAEDARRALFELEAPRLTIAEGSRTGKPRFARIALPPGGAATVTVVVGTTVVRRLDPPCDAGTCAPARLPGGKYTLHVGQLVSDVETGAPARVEWENRSPP